MRPPCPLLLPLLLLAVHISSPARAAAAAAAAVATHGADGHQNAGVPARFGGLGPHLPELFKTVAGDVDNVTAPVTALDEQGRPRQQEDGATSPIPAWIDVAKFNNGFGDFEGPTFRFNFLFDVMAYIIKWTVKGGEVSMANKFIQSKFREDAQVRTPRYRTFAGYTPPLSPVAVPATLIHLLSDNLNVNVVLAGGRLMAISDMAGAMELDPLTLDTIGPITFNDTMNNPMAVITCANPTQLPGDKYMYNYYVDVMGNLPHPRSMNAYTLYRIDTSKPSLEREPMLKIPIPDGEVPYMHSFAHTPNYFVLFKFPLMWNLIGIVAHTHILPEMNWKPGNGTHVLVIDKRTMQVVKEHWTKPVFAYHHVNAFERDDGTVVCDISTVPCDGSEGGAQCNHMNSFNLATLPNNTFNIPNNTFERFVVPVSDNAVQQDITYEVLSPISFDLQALGAGKFGQPYRYVWGVMDHGSGVWWSSLVKIDLHTGEHIEWYQEDHFASEPNFIPRPGATEEDDGVLISTVLGGDLGHSYLLFLNASTMKPIARADAPHFLPFPSHGFAQKI